jgi:heme-degrading monooxygenase HmoA
MYARVWKFGILPEKSEEFDAVAKSVIPSWRQQEGFRALIVVRGGPGEKLEATVVSAWETLEALRNSENSAFQQLLVRVLSCCEPHPSMREEQVLVCEFASPESLDATAAY